MDASFSNPIDLSRTSSWEINKAARKACQNRNGTGTLNVISEGILYGVEFERPHLFSKVNITKIIPLGEHIATLSTSAEMNAFRKAHLGAFNGLSTLNTEIKKVQAKSEVNGMMERVRSGGRRLSENEWNKVVEFTKKGLIDINHTDSNNDTLLHLAARCNEIYMIKSLTKAGVNINAQDKDGNTPLMVAVQEGKLYAVKQLVQLGAKLNPTNPSGQAALTLAEGNTRIRKYLEQARTAQTEISEIIRRNSGGSGLGKLSDSDCKKIEGFIRDGLINVNATYPGDDTLLHLIVHRGQPPLMKQLIKAGANPNARNTSGKTALMAAASYGNRAMIKPLIDRGADPNIQDNDGRTALMAATTAKFQSTIEELVEAGANLNVKNKQGMTASDLAKGNPGMAEHFKPQNKINEIMRRAKHGKISEKDWKIIQGLIKKKSISDANPTNVNGSVNVNSTDSHGNTLLHLAVMSNKPDMVKLLIDAGAYINQPDRSGQTAFTLAAKNGNPEVVKPLIDAGADVNRSDRSGQTALMLATQNGNLDAVKLLVQSRANIDLLAKDRQGKTILQLTENHPAVKKYLETCNEVNKAMITIGNIHVDSTPEERQKAEESIEIIKKFINTRVIDANHSNTNGDTLLHAAVKGNRLDMVKFLVENGADTNKCEPKSDTPLQEAIRTSKDPKIVEYLLNKSTVDLDRKGVGNETPLETAALFGSPEVLSPVLSKYDTAHLNTPNENGKTPIMLAAQNGKTENVKKLIEAGADPNVSGIKNKSALLLAAEAGNREIIDFLKEKGANQEITNSEGLTADRLLEKMEIQKHDRNILKQLAELLKPNMSTEDVTKVKNLIETIKDGENLNIEYAEGNFILLRAVESDNQEIMELLIAKGARIDTMDSRWNGTLETAIMYKNLDMIKFLFKEMKEQGTSIAENPKLQASILEGFLGRTIDRTFDPDILEFLIDQGVDVINTKFRGDEMMQEIAENSLEKAINRETEGIDDSPENRRKIERLKNLIKSIETELAKSEMKSTAQTSTEPPTNPQ